LTVIVVEEFEESATRIISVLDFPVRIDGITEGKEMGKLHGMVINKANLIEELRLPLI
jgi:hypothetical protein